MTDFSDTGYYRMLFELSGDPQYSIDRDAQTFIHVNDAFVKMLGYSRDEVLSGGVKPRDIIHPDYQERVDALDNEKNPITFDRYEIKVITKSGEVKNVEFQVHNVDAGNMRVRIGSFRDVSKRRDLEERLKREVDSQKKKAIETLKSSVRVGQLLDKIRTTPKLTATLLDADSEEGLFEKAAKLITDAEGFNASGVTFFLKEGGRLTVSFSTVEMKQRSFDLAKNTKFARMARGESGAPDSGRVTEEGYPLLGKDRLLGLMYVQYSPSERFLFDEGATIRKGLRDLLRTVASMLGVMIENIRLFRKTQEQAIVDQVSNTYNRRYFDQKVKDEFVRAARYDRTMSLIVVDIDRFKNINDTYGHQQGDVILREAAGIFKRSSREIDIICRYGGDEFVILLPETGFEEARIKAEKLRKLVAATKFTNIVKKKPFKLTVSLGVTSNTNCPDEITLFRRADEALYDAKRAGRNRVGTRLED
jgi:diguanylate cyclase (GGDEF)-like protein/PAS domain S-box-containing protein